jgi:hypothetical protein
VHYDPLRPHRARGLPERWEFTHGTDTLCVYDLHGLTFVKEIPVGERPDCHATSCSNRWVYIACKAGLFMIDQGSLAVTRHVDTGWVFGTNVMPDGSTMLLHDARGGIIVLRDIEDPGRIHVSGRMDVLGTNREMDTLGGKGNFIADNLYLCCGWQRSRLYLVDLGGLPESPRWDVFLEDPRLRVSDDLVVSRDRTRAYCACYGGAGESWVAVVSVSERRVVATIPTGAGTCGLTMSADERFVIASADAEDALYAIDTETEAVCATVSARSGFREAGIRGYIQGISSGGNGDIYVYGCSGNGALAVFHGLGPEAEVTICWPGGRWHGKGGAT